MAQNTEKSPESTAFDDFISDATVATDPMAPLRRFRQRIEALPFPTPERKASKLCMSEASVSSPIQQRRRLLRPLGRLPQTVMREVSDKLRRVGDL
jgi:hypothetical protein